MTTETFYIKKGRRYVPIREYDSTFMDALPHGAHLTIVKPSSKHITLNVNAALAPMIAASLYAEESMCTAIYNAAQLRPKCTPITPKQRKLWNDLIIESGDSAFYVQFDSAHDIALAGLKAMQIEAEKLLQNESVKHAYEQFLFVAKLASADSNTIA